MHHYIFLLLCCMINIMNSTLLNIHSEIRRHGARNARPAGARSRLPSPEVLGDGCPAAEQVGSQRLQLLTEAQHGAQRLAVLVQTGVELLDVQQRLLVHKLQELLGLFGHLRKETVCDLQEELVLLPEQVTHVSD